MLKVKGSTQKRIQNIESIEIQECVHVLIHENKPFLFVLASLTLTLILTDNRLMLTDQCKG